MQTATDNLLTSAPARYQAEPVSSIDWDDAVAAARRSLKADEMLNELADAEDAINVAVAANRLDLIGAIYGAVREAYAVRIAFREVFCLEGKHLPTTNSAAWSVVIAAGVKQ